MTIALIAHTIAQTSDKQNVTTSAIDTTGANFIVIAQTASDSGFPTPTDNKGNTYTKLASHTNSGVTNCLFYVLNPTVGSGHTFSSNSATDHFQGIAVAAFSGVKVSSAFDVQSGNSTTSGTSVSPGVQTPSENGEVVIYSLGDTFTDTPSINDGTITLLDSAVFVSGTAFGIALAYKIQTTAAATNPTWSWSVAGRVETSLASFKAKQNLTADAGSYSVTGADVNLTNHRVLNGDAGAYFVTGSDATLIIFSGFSQPTVTIIT